MQKTYSEQLGFIANTKIQHGFNRGGQVHSTFTCEGKKLKCRDIKSERHWILRDCLGCFLKNCFFVFKKLFSKIIIKNNFYFLLLIVSMMFIIIIIIIYFS